MKRKFNIIDAIIIFLIIIAIAVAGFVFLKVSSDNNTKKTEENTIKFNFVIEVNNLTENMTKVYKEGQKIVFNENGTCTGKIKKIEIHPYEILTHNTVVGEILKTEVPEKYTVMLTIETDVVKKKNVYLCENERLAIGEPFLFKIKGATLGTCYIVDMYEAK